MPDNISISINQILSEVKDQPSLLYGQESLLDTISKTFDKVIKTLSHSQPVDRNVFEEHLDLTLESCLSTKTLFENRDVRDKLYDLCFTKIASFPRNDQRLQNGPLQLNAYFNALGSNGKNFEQRLGKFGSMIRVTDLMIQLLKTIKKDIDTFVTEDSLTIEDVKLSHVAIMNILGLTAITIIGYEYLITMAFDIALDRGSTIPRYRVNFLNKNIDKITKVSNDFLEQKGFFWFLTSMEQLKKNKADQLLWANGRANNFSFLMGVKEVIGIFGGGQGSSPDPTEGLKGLIGFRSANMFLTEYLHNRYLKNQAKLNWFNDRIAYLKMTLEETSPDNPNYQRMLKSIENYDQRVTELDKKIVAYLEGE